MSIRTIFATLLPAASCLIVSGAASAQPLQGEAAAHYVGAFAGVARALQSTDRFEPKTLANGQFVGGLSIDATTALEVNAFFNGGGGSPRVRGGGLDLVLRDPDSRPGLLLLAGLGMQKRSDASALLPYVDFGAGLVMPISSRLRLRTDARLYALRAPDLARGKDVLFEARLNIGIEFAWRAPFERNRIADCGAACNPVPADAGGSGLSELNNSQVPPAPYAVIPDSSNRQCPPVELASLRFDAGGCLSVQVGDAREITFEGTRLTAEGATAVDNLAYALKASPELSLRVVSHSDAEGNEALRERRARLICDRLVGRGVAPGRLEPAVGGDQGERMELFLTLTEGH